ncbi:MAG: GWxTD domain-containing protein [Gemmatimonadota bacterium]
MRIPGTLSPALIGFSLLAAAPLHAQDRITVLQLENFRDSLAGISDSTIINQLTRNLRASARNRGNDRIATLRSGLALLRQAELTDGRLFSPARETFQRALRLEPAWSYAEFGLGLAELGRGRWLAANPAELGNRVGYGSYQAAIRAFAAAVADDHGFDAPGVALARLAHEIRDTAMVRTALTALTPLIGDDSAGPAVLLGIGRLERESGDDSAAVRAFGRFRAAGGNASLADLETARSLLAMGQAAGESLYFAAGASNDSLVAAEQRADLEPIADSGDLVRFDLQEGEHRTAWLRTFWLERDRLDLRSPGERLREHYRRLYYARRHFALQVNRRFFTGVDLFRNLDGELDDRGVVYVRQGEPDERIRTPMFGLNGNETWVYRRPTGDMVLHFGAGGLRDQGGARDDYRLVSSVLDLWRPGAPTDLLLLSRVPASDLYNRMLSWGPFGQQRAAAQERELGEQSAITGVTTDGYQLRYAHPLNAAAELLIIGRHSAARLHVTFAVPHDSAGGKAVRIRLGLFDSAMKPVIAYDTTVNPGSYSRALDADLGHLTLVAPAGTWNYRLAIERGEAGRLFPPDSIIVRNPDGFELSDLALASPERGIVWQPVDGDSVVLSPFQAFPPDGNVEVYYEVYGLAPGRRYETRIAVLETRGERARLELNFSETSAGEVNRLHRTVRLDGLKMGEYWLEVRVRNETGADRRVRRAFKVTG